MSLMGLDGSAQNVSRRYVQNRDYAYNSCRKLFKMLEIYNSIDRYSNSNIRAKFDPKIALVLRNWRVCNSGSKKTPDFQKFGGGTTFRILRQSAKLRIGLAVAERVRSTIQSILRFLISQTRCQSCY